MAFPDVARCSGVKISIQILRKMDREGTGIIYCRPWLRACDYQETEKLSPSHTERSCIESCGIASPEGLLTMGVMKAFHLLTYMNEDMKVSVDEAEEEESELKETKSHLLEHWQQV